VKTESPLGRGTRVFEAQAEDGSNRKVVVKDLWLGADTLGEGHVLNVLRARIAKIGIQLDEERLPFVPKDKIDEFWERDMSEDDRQKHDRINKGIFEPLIKAGTDKKVLEQAARLHCYAQHRYMEDGEIILTDGHEPYPTTHPMSYFPHMLSHGFVRVTKQGPDGCPLQVDDHTLDVMLNGLSVEELQPWDPPKDHQSASVTGSATGSRYDSASNNGPPEDQHRLFYPRSHYRIIFSEVCVDFHHLEGPQEMLDALAGGLPGRPLLFLGMLLTIR
jgi:hypothetical protein